MAPGVSMMTFIALLSRPRKARGGGVELVTAISRAARAVTQVGRRGREGDGGNLRATRSCSQRRVAGRPTAWLT